LLKSIALREVNMFKPTPSSPPRLALMRIIVSTWEALHRTPCQLSPHGSPPDATQPGRRGDSSARKRLLIAATKANNQGTISYTNITITQKGKTERIRGLPSSGLVRASDKEGREIRAKERKPRKQMLLSLPDLIDLIPNPVDTKRDM
jgi:hypothetical protein